MAAVTWLHSLVPVNVLMESLQFPCNVRGVAPALDPLGRFNRPGCKRNVKAKASQACATRNACDFVDFQLELLCAISILARAWDKSVG